MGNFQNKYNQMVCPLLFQAGFEIMRWCPLDLNGTEHKMRDFKALAQWERELQMESAESAMPSFDFTDWWIEAGFGGKLCDVICFGLFWYVLNCFDWII